MTFMWFSNGCIPTARSTCQRLSMKAAPNEYPVNANCEALLLNTLYHIEQAADYVFRAFLAAKYSLIVAFLFFALKSAQPLQRSRAAAFMGFTCRARCVMATGG